MVPVGDDKDLFLMMSREKMPTLKNHEFFRRVKDLGFVEGFNGKYLFIRL